MKKFHFSGYVLGVEAHVENGIISQVPIVDIQLPKQVAVCIAAMSGLKKYQDIIDSIFIGKSRFEWNCLAEENTLVASKGKEGFHVEPLVNGVPQGQLGIFQSTFDRTIRQLQTDLPWSNNYSRDFLASTVKHKNLVHALSHVGKAAGKLYALADDMDHGLAIDEDPTLHDQFGKYVADLVICSLRIANEFPGGVLDLQKAVEARIERNRRKNLPKDGYACGGYADEGNFEQIPRREDVLPNRRTVHVGVCPVNLKEPQRHIVGTSYVDCARVFFDPATAERLFHNNLRDLFAKGIDGRLYR